MHATDYDYAAMASSEARDAMRKAEQAQADVDRLTKILRAVTDTLGYKFIVEGDRITGVVKDDGTTQYHSQR